MTKKTQDLNNLIFSIKGPRENWNNQNNDSLCKKVLIAGMLVSQYASFPDYGKGELHDDAKKYLDKFKNIAPSFNLFAIMQEEFGGNAKKYLIAEISKDDYEKIILPIINNLEESGKTFNKSLNNFSIVAKSSKASFKNATRLPLEIVEQILSNVKTKEHFYFEQMLLKQQLKNSKKLEL